MDDYYRVLGIKQFATPEEIKKAYRLLAKKWHPDCNQGSFNSTEIFKKINEAYYVLSKPELKMDYDFRLKSYLNALREIRRFHGNEKIQKKAEANDQLNNLRTFMNKMKTAFENVIYENGDSISNWGDKTFLNRIKTLFENVIYEDEIDKYHKNVSMRYKFKRSLEKIIHLIYENKG